MFDDYKYSSFTLTNGMILHEIMQQKKIGFDEVFVILGPKSVVMEIINGKRFLKNSQIKQLAELFGINQDVFSVESENNKQSELSLEEYSSNKNSFLNEDSSNEINEVNHGNFESHTINDEEDIEKNQLSDFQNHEIKQYWDE